MKHPGNEVENTPAVHATNAKEEHSEDEQCNDDFGASLVTRVVPISRAQVCISPSLKLKITRSVPGAFHGDDHST